MVRAGLFLLCITIFACKSGKKKDRESEFDYEQFSEKFAEATAFEISDTALLRNKDTTAVRSAEFSKFLSDSLKAKIFGKGSKPKYIALKQMKTGETTVFYFMKVLSGNKKAVLLYVFDKGV